MGKLKQLLLIAATAALAACSGSENTLVGSGTGTGGLPAADVASLTVLTSSPQIPSDGTAPATITALVRDSNNNVVADAPVLFAANSGSLVVSQPITTDENGVVTATLSTGGDPTNRTITVNATVDTIQSSVDVDVIGTLIDINGPSSLPAGDQGNYNVVLTDAGGNGIGGQQVTITSANNNGISQTPLLTDADGQASFVLTANSSGNDTLTAAALGIEDTQAVDVSNDAFAFSTPAAGAQIALNTNRTVTVNWQAGGSPVVGDTVTFTTTRGTLSAGSATTDSNGDATVTISATNAGPAVITATNALGTSTQLTVQFIATVADSLELQANPFTVPTNDQSTITAIVRDPNGNLVTGATVSFVLSDVTGGSLSVAQAVTNNQGRAQTFYSASSTTSQVDGVQIDASVLDTPSVNDSVNLTVARRELFISIGTGNEIFEPNTAQYRKEWIIQVTDANGNGVDMVDLTVTVLSERYWDGARAYVDPPGAWLTRIGTEALPTAGCTDEDINNRNGILDPGEDLNTSGRIEAGNIATVVPQNPGPNGEVITDANGFAVVDVYYAQEFALWVEVTLEAKASVQGTEFAEATTFRLPILAADVAQENTEPPGQESPFGTDGNCATPPPGLP